jgi:ATP-dependent Lhr-like helicase
MSQEQAAFDRLHPAVQHHIVNTLGWPGLRPTQQAAVAPILDGQNCILLAPTAGGKTEAAIFPLLSKILTEDWRGLSVLYVCPIRALLNNLEPRLSYYFGLVGRRVGIWHGDVSDSAKRKILKDPPDLLLTTPESLEGMLISADDQKRELLLDVRMIVIDEMHAFCGDDRGWHVRSIIYRLQRLNRLPLQVIGLTATVGNPESLINWMVAGRPSVVVGEGHSGTDADIVIDYVGSLENAATIISRLHVGEKRLVFCDSRAKTEELAAYLRDLGVQTFVSHSSLSVDERRQAEKAFAEEPNCVIVATSTLELGIDVGDLDRVIQIDAPTTVASFLQRMGRTGRRAGSRRNCLFLATEDEGLLIGGAIVRLWREGFVESIEPPGNPWHLVAHQAMAMVLQNRGVARTELEETLGEMFGGLDPSGVARVIDTMIERSILWAEESGLLGLGTVGEEEFGRRHFESIVSTFNSPLLLTVMFGQREIGFVDPMTIGNDPARPANLILAGRYWRVVSTDWRARLVYVEQTEDRGKASWLGSSRALRFVLCQTIKKILIDQTVPAELSSRANARLKNLAESFPALEMGTTTAERVVRNGKAEWTWWTFGGGGANFLLADSMGKNGNAVRSYDNFRISLAEVPTKVSVPEPRGTFSASGGKFIRQLGRQLKFHQCLLESQMDEVMADRLCDYGGAYEIVKTGLAVVQ